MEPTKLTLLISLCCNIASTVSFPPFTILSTPGGIPASRTSSHSSLLELGSLSDGLSIKQFPQAIATGNIHIGTIIGKLKGVMPAHTPIG